MNYGVAEYRCEGRDSTGYFTYRWVDPTFALERKIEELRAEVRKLVRREDELLRRIYGPSHKDDAFEDGMGGW